MVALCALVAAALAGPAPQEESARSPWFGGGTLGSTFVSGPVPGGAPEAWNPRLSTAIRGQLGLRSRGWTGRLGWGLSRTQVLCGTCDSHLQVGTGGAAGRWIDPDPLSLSVDKLLGLGERTALDVGVAWSAPASRQDVLCNPGFGSGGPFLGVHAVSGPAFVMATSRFTAHAHRFSAAPVDPAGCSRALRDPSVPTLTGAVTPQSADGWYGGAPNPAWTSSTGVSVFDPHRWLLPKAERWGTGLSAGLDLRRFRSDGAAQVTTLTGPVDIGSATTPVDPWLPASLSARRWLVDGLSVSATARAAFPLRVADPATRTRAGLARTALTLALEARPREDR
ncbi:MAG: hypothetical protein ACI8PZ_005739 [Myxococcota bacterium]